MTHELCRGARIGRCPRRPRFAGLRARPRRAARSRARWRCAAQLHRHPELGFDLPVTQAAVLSTRSPACRSRSPPASRSSSVVAVLRGGRPGPTVLLRGDMDALPLPGGHRPGVRLRDRRRACTPAATTRTSRCSPRAARLLAGRRDALAGRVRVHVPARRGGLSRRPAHARRGPARRSGPAGGTTALRPAHHLDAAQPACCDCRPGPDDGVGRHLPHHGHGPRRPRVGMPHDALDPVPAAARWSSRCRRWSPGGSTRSPPAVRHDRAASPRARPPTSSRRRALLEGTMRTLSEATPRRWCTPRSSRSCQHIAAAHGCTAEVEIEPGYPVTVNDDAVGRTCVGRRPRRCSAHERVVADAGPDHGRRGLLVRAAAGAGRDGVPRRLPARASTRTGGAEPLQPGACSTRPRWPHGVAVYSGVRDGRLAASSSPPRARAQGRGGGLGARLGCGVGSGLWWSWPRLCPVAGAGDGRSPICGQLLSCGQVGGATSRRQDQRRAKRLRRRARVDRGSVLRAAAAAGRHDLGRDRFDSRRGRRPAGRLRRRRPRSRGPRPRAPARSRSSSWPFPCRLWKKCSASLPEGVRLTDVVSVKGPVADLVRRVAPHARYVGGHPMAGTSSSGWTAGRADLFHEPPGSSPPRTTPTWTSRRRRSSWPSPAKARWSCPPPPRARRRGGPHLPPAAPPRRRAGLRRRGRGPLPLALAAGSFSDGTRVAGTAPS